MAAFDYNIAVTGNCNGNVGKVILTASGGTPPYTFDWYTPNLGVDSLTATSTRNFLNTGVYAVRINDSTLPINQEFDINVTVSNGICADMFNVSGTTCNQDNGSFTVSASTDFLQVNYDIYKDGSFVGTQLAPSSGNIFPNLAPGVYSVVVRDGGGCSAQTESCIVTTSTPFDYDFYIVNDTQCDGATGKLYITGLTSTPPYTYEWFNGSSQSFVTGLTQGVYGVTVTSGDGCSLFKEVTIQQVPALGLGSITAVNPSCFASDGSITLTITGGTGPYYYSASTGEAQITYLQSVTFSGLAAGVISVAVTDAGLCKNTFSTNLVTPGTFKVISINSVNSTCNSNGGQIILNIEGGSPPYTYTLVYPSSATSSITSNSTNQIYSNLSAGDYTVIITDQASCVYSQEITIITEDLFTLSYDIDGVTCDGNNGSFVVTKTTGGTAPYNYILSNGDSFLNRFENSVTFSNLESGVYSLSVSDSSGCTKTEQVTIAFQPSVSFSLQPTGCQNGTNGTITAFITGGAPPFNLTWSSNVGSQTGIYVTGLTAGTYNLLVTDSNGCSLSKSTVISCNSVFTTYDIYTMCENDLALQYGTKRGMIQMLNDGYEDLTSGNTNCILNNAIFTAQVEVTGTTYQTTFYTGYTLLDVSSDSLWYYTVETLLESIPNVLSVTIDSVTSQIIIQTTQELSNKQFKIELLIDYDISCET